MPAPVRKAPSAEALAKSIAAYFLTGGHYKAGAGPMQPESAAQAIPAVSARGIPSAQAMHGFSGLTVQSVGYSKGASTPAVHIYLTQGSQKLFKSVPSEVNGVAISVHKMGPISVKPEAAAVATNRGNIYVRGDRVACGSSCAPTGENYSGTFGALIEAVGSGNQKMFGLSNNHVFAACNHTPVGMPILSPSNMDGRPGARAPGEICRHSSIVELRSGVPSLVDPCEVDAAIAELSDRNAVSSWQGDDDSGYDTPQAVAEPSAGLRVKKFGRTTGLSLGVVESLINTPTPIPYQASEFRATVWFRNIWIVRSSGNHPFALPGDSGSLVVAEDESNSVGLVFAASRDGNYGWIAPLQKTLSELGNFRMISGHGVSI